MAVNNFLPFAPTDTGTNLLSQSDYSVATDRTIGNQPGVASSKLVNKAIRQSAYISSQVAQYVADKTGSDVLDDATPAKLLAQLNAALLPLAPVVTKYLTATTGNHNLSYIFFIATGSATAAATYTNNGVTYTVSNTVASGTRIIMSGSGAPTVSGTLTKTSGTGDATLSFYAMRVPLYLKVKGVGGGGGGAGSANGTDNGSNGGNGGTTSFATPMLIAGGGVGATKGGANSGPAGGTASIGTGASGLALPGQAGGGSSFGTASGNFFYVQSGYGGSSPLFGGGGGSAAAGNGGSAGATNSGGGGSGGGCIGGGSAYSSGGGGSGGGGFDAVVYNPSGTYAWAVGGGGGGGAAGVAGFAGASGAVGQLYIEEHYQ